MHTSFYSFFCTEFIPEGLRKVSMRWKVRGIDGIRGLFCYIVSDIGLFCNIGFLFKWESEIHDIDEAFIFFYNFFICLPLNLNGCTLNCSRLLQVDVGADGVEVVVVLPVDPLVVYPRYFASEVAQGLRDDPYRVLPRRVRLGTWSSQGH